MPTIDKVMDKIDGALPVGSNLNKYHKFLKKNWNMKVKTEEGILEDKLNGVAASKLRETTERELDGILLFLQGPSVHKVFQTTIKEFAFLCIEIYALFVLEDDDVNDGDWSWMLWVAFGCTTISILQTSYIVFEPKRWYDTIMSIIFVVSDTVFRSLALLMIFYTDYEHIRYTLVLLFVYFTFTIAGFTFVLNNSRTQPQYAFVLSCLLSVSSLLTSLPTIWTINQGLGRRDAFFLLKIETVYRIVWSLIISIVCVFDGADDHLYFLWLILGFAVFIVLRLYMLGDKIHALT
eukprot:UN28118